MYVYVQLSRATLESNMSQVLHTAKPLVVCACMFRSAELHKSQIWAKSYIQPDLKLLQLKMQLPSNANGNGQNEWDGELAEWISLNMSMSVCLLVSLTCCISSVSDCLYVCSVHMCVIILPCSAIKPCLFPFLLCHVMNFNGLHVGMWQCVGLCVYLHEF